MAIPWLVVLKSVPWSEVIRNAPAVVEGARKLWNTVRKDEREEDNLTEATAVMSSPLAQVQDASQLQARLEALEASIEELHTQMVASSELIKTLAEQNTQLIGRIEVNRVKMAWLTLVTVMVLVIAVLSLVLGINA